jgi:hypothetical protein
VLKVRNRSWAGAEGLGAALFPLYVIHRLEYSHGDEASGLPKIRNDTLQCKINLNVRC